MRKVSFMAVAAALILAGVGGWAASTTRAQVDGPATAQVDPTQLMLNVKDLATARYADYSVVFE